MSSIKSFEKIIFRSVFSLSHLDILSSGLHVMGQRVVILEVQSFTVARGFTVECQWNGGSGGPGEGLGLPLL